MTAGQSRPYEQARHDHAPGVRPGSSPPDSPPPPNGTLSHANGRPGEHHPRRNTPAPAGAPSQIGDTGESDQAAPKYTTRDEVESLGVSLGPALHEACGDRLGDIDWFQSPWQKSGAATGFTSWRLPDGSVVGAIAKVPVGFREYDWSVRLGEVDPMWWRSEACRHLPVPRVLASGTELGGYDIAWLVVEKVSGRPISKEMNPESLEKLFAAAALFHKLAVESRPLERVQLTLGLDWVKVLARARQSCEDNDLEGAGEWIELIDRVTGLLPGLLERWHGRPVDSWCHGDLHPGNAMIRCDETCPEDRCGVLIDLALVHPGHWVEDALYLERLYWGREDALGGVNPVEALGRHRLALGLSADEADLELADIRRVLMGATSPAFLGQENNRVYLEAARGRLRKIIPTLGHLA
jgi:hypothetical protein